MTTIPEEYPPKIPPSSQSPKKIEGKEQEALRTIKELGGLSTSQVRPLTGHAMEALSDPRASFESWTRQKGIPSSVFEDWSDVHERFLSAIQSNMESVYSLKKDPEAQHNAIRTLRDGGVDSIPGMDTSTKKKYYSLLDSLDLVHEIIHKGFRTYFNTESIQVVGPQDSQEMQQHLQSHFDQGRIPQKMAQQFQINMPHAIAVTQQQSQASQQKGKAVAAQCIMILTQAADAIALEEKTKKEQTSESKKTVEISTAPLSQKQKSGETLLQKAHVTTHVFETVQGKRTEEKAEELKTIQREKDRLHEEAMLLLEQKEKSKSRGILSQEIKKSKK